jgi:hypothetical protein
MERRDLYQDDLTEERQPTPAQRDDVAHTQHLDPDVIDSGTEAPPHKESGHQSDQRVPRQPSK